MLEWNITLVLYLNVLYINFPYYIVGTICVVLYRTSNFLIVAVNISPVQTTYFPVPLPFIHFVKNGHIHSRCVPTLKMIISYHSRYVRREMLFFTTSSRWQKLSITTRLQLSRGVVLTDKCLIFDWCQWFSYMCLSVCMTELSLCSYIWPVAPTEQILHIEYWWYPPKIMWYIILPQWLPACNSSWLHLLCILTVTASVFRQK